jgi:hypothetical protein
MTDLIISKKCFVCDAADPKTKARVMAHITGVKKKLPVSRYHSRYKTAVIPVMSTVFLLWGYLVYQNISTPIRVQNDIAQTQTTINELITMIDSETF